MNDRSPTITSTGSPTTAGSRVRRLVRSTLRTRGSARSRSWSWLWPTSTATTSAAPCWSAQSVKPPVEAPQSSTRAPSRNGPRSKCSTAPSSLAPARLTHRGGGPCTTIASPGPTWRAALVAGAPPTVTRPAAMSAWARSRLVGQPPSHQLGVEAPSGAHGLTASRPEHVGHQRGQVDGRRGRRAGRWAGRPSVVTPLSTSPNRYPRATAKRPSVSGRSPTITPSGPRRSRTSRRRRFVGLAGHLGRDARTRWRSRRGWRRHRA